MTPNEIAAHEGEYLRAVATATVSGPTITLVVADSMLEIECVTEDRFLIGRSPTKGGFQTQVGEPRVTVNRKELYERARAWREQTLSRERDQYIMRDTSQRQA